MHRCSRCGRTYPSRLEVHEKRRPDGTLEVICKHCQSSSTCSLCGFSSPDRKDFAVRKVDSHWRVLCAKCLKKVGG
jgi:hypothetical protein